MITITYNKKTLRFSGHANSAKKGNDLVCAGVSAIVFGATSWFNNNEVNILVSKSNIVQFTIKKNFLQNYTKFLLLLKQLQFWQKKYKKNIKIIKKGK